MTSGDDRQALGLGSLEEAATGLREAEAAVVMARRRLNEAIVAAVQAGDSIAGVAERTGRDITEVRNLLAAVLGQRF
ncbi:hypothetical protein [Actinacidiphila glaucinigra]|uniref:hypothetical protein n=1 Tax=Actinacidiphila glaucinigra TaxID=235986 RepID=UPI0035DB331D